MRPVLFTQGRWSYGFTPTYRTQCRPTPNRLGDFFRKNGPCCLWTVHIELPLTHGRLYCHALFAFEKFALRNAPRQNQCSNGRQALRTSPQNLDVHYALGLSLVRQHRMADALTELRKAATLGPQTARYRYVYAVALYGAGQRIQAIKELESALKQHPYDREILVALMSYLRESGDDKRASVYAARLAELEPGVQQRDH